MPKRKRSHEVSQQPGIDPNGVEKPVGHQRHALSASTLDQYEKILFRALRLARGFERQKLGRRQKVAKQARNDAETARLNAEVAALKALDLPSVAKLHLYKSMLKSKPMSAAPAFPSDIPAKIEAASRPSDISSCNVQARLFNTNAVKTTMAEIMSGVGSILGVSSANISTKKGRLRASDIAKGGDLAKNHATGVRVIREGQTTLEQDTSQLNNLSVLHDTHKSKVAHTDEHSDEGSENNDVYASRLGNSSDDVSTEENPVHKSRGNLMVDHERSRKLSFSSSKSTSPSISDHSNPKRLHRPTAAPKSTAFLPSLTLGGYISDSNSDHSEAPELRKNRRGQRARRQIWEKKYGSNARHLQHQVRSQNRDRDWDHRAGARPTNDRIKGRRDKGQGPLRGGRAVPLSSGANADPVKARSTKGESQGKQVTGPLHPSWEAAKRAKEATKSIAFQGKKLVFD